MRALINTIHGCSLFIIGFIMGINAQGDNTSGYLNQAKDMIRIHEGVRYVVYKDSLGIPTIGIGYNLQNHNAVKDLNNLGLSLQNVLNGKPLSDSQVNILFNRSVDIAVKDVKKYYPDFDNLPLQAKIVLIDMSFNLGYNRLKQFKKLKKALELKDYNRAADEMVNSLWYRQVKTRGVTLVNIMRNI